SDLLFFAGLPLTLAAFAVACRATWLCGSQRRSGNWIASSGFWLSAMAALGIVLPARHGYAVLGLFCVGLFGSDDATWRQRSVVTLAVAASALHLVTPFATPQPQ